MATCLILELACRSFEGDSIHAISSAHRSTGKRSSVHVVRVIVAALDYTESDGVILRSRFSASSWS